LLCITAGYWFGFAVSDYFDVRVDSDAPDKAVKNFFVQYPLSEQVLHRLALGLLACLFLGFLQFGWRGVLLFALAILVVWAYSSPPFRLKSRPILELLCHALFVQTFPYLICLIVIDVPILAIDYWLPAFFFFSSLSAQLEQQTRDYELDKRHDHNFTVRFGKQMSLTLQKMVTVTLLLIGTLSLVLEILPHILVPIGIL